ncbi:tRNA (adenosine(37)-N6)-dimethylallyltransferase MiaA [Dyadobacter sp. CY345]|uniref:tRNA (adenosine(37)-N6)-dimethylallyltransferase MiaA n=1 Tax=Dyadobacter sp. CY345 TaxID=2909335 RepID=UPI001F022478|nr:tRNA (adenosine(37)-N6)-dimethylallyltransferase MiaA [Dyadobacter sp. CY345]MCF2442520.1 tRNA (adenosine(37)-N6)-dimethylallyltransferase MiaA [Dyadobacter sp. CY345]
MPNSQAKYLITIAGPTAVGKTELSIKLAGALGTEIISADSRQIFRELSIGTAKPNAAELAAVPHHFINSHSITETYSAGDFERDALGKLDELFSHHDCVVMTGGSGLYIKAVCEGLDVLPAPLEGLRETLTARLINEGLEVLQEEIRVIDPAFAETKEIHNPQRVVRALEVFKTTGVPISQYQQKNIQQRPFKQILIALDRDRKELYDRIDLRMDNMLKEGLVEEAKSVIQFRDCHALQTVGYKEVYGYLDGLYDEKEMVRRLKQNSRRYAKRQLTWFRHQGNFKWFQPNQFNELLNFVQTETGLI